MITSMTGYGQCSQTVANNTLKIEIKTLNSKGIEINMKLPSIYRELELDIRKAIAEQLIRGKVDVYCMMDSSMDTQKPILNTPVIKAYQNQLMDMAPELTVEKSLELALRLPEVLKPIEESEDGVSHDVMDMVKKACKAVMEFRSQEGQSMAKDLKSNVNNILSRLLMIEPYEGIRLARVKEKLLEQMAELQIKVNEERLEQELVMYSERFDINEEKVRLKNHCEFFLNEMENGTAQGKKLGFIAQEMGREINTLGSKANQMDIQKLVVEMKDELEKIKEQVLNAL